METRKLSLNEMEMVEGGSAKMREFGCVATGSLAVTIWAIGFGMVNPFIGAAIGYFGGLAVSAICDQ